MEKAARAMQGRYHPGRPAFYALDRLQTEIRRARQELAGQRRGETSREA